MTTRKSAMSAFPKVSKLAWRLGLASAPRRFMPSTPNTNMRRKSRLPTLPMAGRVSGSCTCWTTGVGPAGRVVWPVVGRTLQAVMAIAMMTMGRANRCNVRLRQGRDAR